MITLGVIGTVVGAVGIFGACWILLKLLERDWAISLGVLLLLLLCAVFTVFGWLMLSAAVSQ